MSEDMEVFPSGMIRSRSNGKIRYDLVFDGPLVERLARHLTRGAERYGDRNWLRASSMEEAARFRESAVRHFVQWLRGDDDEDHYAATVFNMSGYEYVRERLERR